MPAAADRCVKKLLAGWSADPSSRPTPRKGEDGKPQDAKSQAWAICQASQKAEEELTRIALEGAGMTLMGLAVTNRPHLKGLPPVEIVERSVSGEQKELLRIPLLLQGIFRHSRGNLVFNPRVFNRLQQNLRDNVIEQDVCIDSKHNPDRGALGWIGPGIAGTGLEIENDILVAYAEPTPFGKEKVEEKAFRYASAELSTNFIHPQIGGKFEAAKLSTDEIDPPTLEQIIEEANMPDDKDPTAGNDTVTLEEERQKREALEARLQQLEEQQQQREEALTLRLQEAETRLAEADAGKYRAQIGAIITKAEHYRDGNGRGHPKILLEVARAVLLMEDYTEEDGVVIHLEYEEDEEPTVAQVAAYYRNAIVHLLENLPGIVPTEPGTHPGDDRPSNQLEEDEATDEEIADFLGVELEELRSHKEG